MITVEFRRKLDPKFHKDPLCIEDSIGNQKKRPDFAGYLMTICYWSIHRFVMQMNLFLDACETCQQTILIGKSFLKTASNIWTESTTCKGSIL